MRREQRVKRRVLLLLGLLILLLICILAFKNCGKVISISHSPEISLYLSRENRVVKMPLEDYIIGTVAAEMPAGFGLEALKAQAVCVRSYTLNKLLSNKQYPMHADVSDDIYSCQAYISKEEFMQRNSQNYQKLWEKISQACQATKGQIMAYNGMPLDALYHSTCGGRTESAADAWGRDVPYLRSVKCGYCGESKYYQTCQVFSSQDLQKITGVKLGNKTSISINKKSSSGRVQKLIINGVSISGEKFRAALHLPSTYWELKGDKNKLIINSRGYGHGIGMCQYGANGMAQAGKSYRDILTHYYQHFEFCQLQWNE